MEPKYQRKRLWIDPPLQSRLLLRTGLYLLFYLAFVWHVGFAYWAMKEVATGGLGKGIGSLYLEFCEQQLSLLLALLLVLPPILYDLLKFSHRIAGPLYRCRKVMGQMAAGEAVPEFTPRQRDLLREFFQTFNALIKAWNARVGAESRPANGRAAEADDNRPRTSPYRALTP
jgi:hypothetical protein